MDKGVETLTGTIGMARVGIERGKFGQTSGNWDAEGRQPTKIRAGQCLAILLLSRLHRSTTVCNSHVKSSAAPEKSSSDL